MIAKEGQSSSDFEAKTLLQDIVAHLTAISGIIRFDTQLSSAENLSKASLLASELTDGIKNGYNPALYSVLKILSLLNRALKAFNDEEITSAGSRIAAAIEAARMLASQMGMRQMRSLSTNLQDGEILPPEKVAQAKPGRILLALEPSLAKDVARLLRRFGHTVMIVHDPSDLFLAFGFFERGTKAGESPAAVVRHVANGKIDTYSLSRKRAADESRWESLPDVMVGDMCSAGFAGFELQEFLRTCGEFIDTRMIVLSPFAESKSTARVIQLGADGYFKLDVEPSVLLARIESSVERKRFGQRSQLYIAALAHARASLEEEFRRGAEYVRCLLPGKISGTTLSTDWAFTPSASLGGDLFGYHRLDDGRMVFFMIDVGGHGLQSALYSVTIFDVLRGEGLKNVDFGDPVAVMRGLNHAFRMEERNNMLFTLWYGVWDEKTRILTHASAGSPPAVLIVEGGGALELKAEGMVAGADPDAVYRQLDIQVPRESRLFLFSDGIYEFFTKEGEILGLEAFVQLLERTAADIPHDRTSIGDLHKKLSALSAVDHFQDDVSLLEVRFD
ncbi:MAG TPA: SpoIIE family protein phosphatase [Rectinemataceae bacterium]|nr:SpoIIE family protein phosphatase [Rectinemataceae bacterium]